MFTNIKTKAGVYDASYDATKREVVVKVLDKEKPFSELKGTGLIAGLTKLYNENNLVKVQVGSQPERNLVEIRTSSGSDEVFMQNIALIVGSDIGNEINGQGSKINTLADFIDKTVVLKLTVAQESCDNAVTLDYTIEGVDGTDVTAPAAPTIDAKINGSVEITPPADKDTKSIEVTYTPEGATEPVTVTATKGSDGKWTVPAGSDITVDPGTGKITIPADKVKDETDVTAKAKDKMGNVSDPATEKAKASACLTQDALQQQFEDAINPMFTNIKTKAGVYDASYDATKREVVVKVLDKEKPFSELKGTGLIAGLTKLYNENNLVKVQVGSQPERNLVEIRTSSGSDEVFMQNIALIVGSDIGNEINGQGSKINTLADFIDKTVVLKLTVAQESCDNAVTLDYTIEGVDGTDVTAPAAPTIDAKINGSVEITPPADKDTKSIEVTYTPEGATEPVTVTATKGSDGQWTVPAGSDITVDPTTGKITIPADKVKDGTDVTAKAKDKTGNESTAGKATAKAKTSSGGSSGGVINTPSKPEPKPEEPDKGDLNTADHYQYLTGYPDGTFAPNKGMTRAEVATMFTRLLKDRPIKGKAYKAGLSDIHSGDWYADAVGYAVQKGIVSGYPDGTFKPNQVITRAEFASIAARFADLTESKDLSFSDLDASYWGYKAIRQVAAKGWISGYPDNTFRPEQAITRAEVATISNRMLNRTPDFDRFKAHTADLPQFSDVQPGDWFYGAIMEATMGPNR